jgi:hypothetical protein
MSLCQMISKLEGLLPGVSNTNSSSMTDAQSLARWEHEWKNDASVAGTTAVAERTVFRAKRKCRVTGIWVIPDAAATADATNFLTVLIDRRPATDYTTPTNMVTFAMDTAGTDNLVAFTPKDIGPASSYASATATVFDLALADVVTVEVTKSGGSGLALPICTVLFQLEPRD